MAYKFRANSSDIFEAKIKVNGAALNKSFCRLVVESEDWSLVFKGEIDSVGNCTIPIKNLNEVLPDGTTGQMQLEVIAEDTYFVPWTSEFEVQVAKSVQVEVVDSSKKLVEEEEAPTVEIVQEQKPKPKIKKSKPKATRKPVQETVAKKPADKKTYLKELTRELIKEGVTIDNVQDNKSLINKLGFSLMNENNIPADEMAWIIDNTLKLLAKRGK